MTSEQRYGWQVQLHLRLRTLSGVAFQDFFADVMTRAHGDDFVPTRPRGLLGDKGCDGYLASAGRVFACYGKVNDASPAVADILSKMDDDYLKASRHLGDEMREWWFVHNMFDGTPTDATILKLGQMRRAHAGHEFGHFGRGSFQTCIFGLPESDIVSLIGMAVTAEQTRNMRLEIVADLVDGIMAAVDEASFVDDPEPRPVPRDKLVFNKVPNHWCVALRAQMTNAGHVAGYLRNHRDVERGPKVAAAFRTRYRLLRDQELSPGDIMDALYEGIVGIGTVTTDRVIAAHAVLAFLFDACDIFEDRPVGDTA